jgi:undecaprenyl-diphosphatase
VPFDQLVILAIVQGLTEFLPVSSSGHLNLVHLLTDWEDQGPLIDVSVHVGSLLAVLIYFWRDVVMLLRGAWHAARGRFTPEAKILALLIVSSMPIFAIGFVVLKLGLLESMRTLEVIAWANLAFAFALLFGDRIGMTVRRVEHMSLFDAIAVGLAQVISVVPGASRAGVTITMARLLGYERREAARFSMLLSIPTIVGLGLATAYELHGSGDLVLQADAAIGAIMAAGAALLSIWAMMALLKRTSLLPFVIYRVVLGGLLLGLIYDWWSLP